jgi:predicted ATPase
VTSGLLERDRELDTLDGLLADGLAGDAVLALIEGPAGIGKSRLLACARELGAGAGYRVLAARGSTLEREFPFGVVRQLFEPLVADPSGRDRWLAGPAAPAARVFAPPDDGQTFDVSYGVLDGLFRLAAGVAAEQPLLLAIDDLHWCDRASLRFVSYLAGRLEGRRVVAVAGLRTGETAAEPILDDISQDPAATAIRPRALSAPAVAALVRSQLGSDADEAFWAACHTATGGNPLLLGELLRTLAAEQVQPAVTNVEVIRDIGPRAVARSVLLRLSRLPGESVAVARGWPSSATGRACRWWPRWPSAT